MSKITFTRQELYDLVWSTPLSTLSLKYGMSYHKLRNACIKMNIPLPDYGHWMRVQHKKPVHIKDLPTESTSITAITFNLGNDPDKVTKRATEGRNDLKKKLLSDKKLPFTVPSKLRNPDQLIVAALNDLTNEKHPDYSTGLINTSGGILDITVAPKNVQRALRFMNALIGLVIGRGHEVKITDNGTCAIVFGEEIVICLQEKLRIEETKDKYGWRSRQYFPSDVLTFRMWKNHRHRQKVWGTGKQNIEELLPDILVNLELLAKNEKEERKRREEEHKIWLEKQKIENELKEQKDNEFKRFKKMLFQATLLHKANILRDYVKTVEKHAMSHGELTGDQKD